MTHSTSITFVLPCLNEAKTLPLVLTAINEVRQRVYPDRFTEVVVSDNGSTDESVPIAQAHGARVVACPERGYGSALTCGFKAAKGDIVVYADADDTYDFRETPALIAALDKGADLVIGSRMTGTIKPGAMPSLHRYLGTPVLNAIINILYGRRGGLVVDCNSGFRGFYRDKFFEWDVRGKGMEFASEMLVKALGSGVKIAHVPVTLRPDHKGRIPHLKTWKDGMRHLLQILLNAPWFFNAVGLTIWGVAWTALLFSMLFGPILIGSVSVFGLHTMMFMLLGSHVGLAIWSIGLLLAARQTRRPSLYTRLLNLREDILLWSLVAFALIGAALMLWIVATWIQHDLQLLALEQPTLVLIAAASNLLVLASQIMAGHLVKLL
ncbi:MAG: glycosyltransferase family 2 protein [Candidatus Andersenbacteria bacterium]